MGKKLKIAIAADHGGFLLKQDLIEHLVKHGFDVVDCGAYTIEASDYPPLGYRAARAVSTKKSDYGIVICKSGFGMAIIANKVKGIRSAVCDTVGEALSARQHNDCNVLSLAANRVRPAAAKKIVDVFLTTNSEPGRHKRRVDQITKLERAK
jgi:ribose 5-phosphate isomerase B